MKGKLLGVAALALLTAVWGLGDAHTKFSVQHNAQHTLRHSSTDCGDGPDPAARCRTKASTVSGRTARIETRPIAKGTNPFAPPCALEGRFDWKQIVPRDPVVFDLLHRWVDREVTRLANHMLIHNYRRFGLFRGCDFEAVHELEATKTIQALNQG